jgi:hypothetical protein
VNEIRKIKCYGKCVLKIKFSFLIITELHGLLTSNCFSETAVHRSGALAYAPLGTDRSGAKFTVFMVVGY